MKDQIASKVINTLENWNAPIKERWTARYGNCVGYWTFSFGALEIQDSLCVHVLHNGEEIASYHRDDKFFDEISRALWNARQSQREKAKQAFLAD